VKSFARNNAAGIQFSFDCLQCEDGVSSEEILFPNPKEYLEFEEIDFGTDSRHGWLECWNCETQY
jgi:hypothetical protein